MATMTRNGECIAPPVRLLLAFELGQRTWKLGFSGDNGQRPRIRQMPAGAVGLIEKEVIQAKMRLGVPLEAPVISCYEAGREGFWVHRYLVAHGVTNYVVDSASIEVNRRARRAKTDRLDLSGLLSLLARYLRGDRHAWRVARVPPVAAEDARQLPRTWETLTADRTRLINRMKGLLMTQGVQVPIDTQFLDRVRGARLWDGTPVPPGLQERLAQDWAQLRHVEAQLRERKRARAELRMRRRQQATPLRNYKRFAGSAWWAPGSWPPRSLAGDRSTIVENWAAWWAWCRRRIRAAKRRTTRALRVRGIRTCVA